MISPNDFFRLESVDTEEAIADAYAQFSLYHGSDISKMLEWEKAKKGDSDPAISTKFKYSSRTNRYQVIFFCILHKVLFSIA